MLKIKELRLEKGLTQKELAQKINSTNKNIWAYENEFAIPPLDVLQKIADAFEVSLDYLVGRSDDLGNIVIKTEAQPLTTNEKEIVEIMHDLPSFFQVQIIEYARYIAEKQSSVLKHKNTF